MTSAPPPPTQPPTCELQPPNTRRPHPPGALAISGIYKGTRITARVCRLCVHDVVAEMRLYRYQDIRITAPEDTRDYTPHRG